MKWGVRRKLKSGVKSAKSLAKDFTVNNAKSIKRERSWNKVKTSKVSDRTLKRNLNRMRLENDYNKYTKGISGRREYYKRSTMSTKDLKNRVDRLRNEALYSEQAKLAVKRQKKHIDTILNEAGHITPSFSPQYAAIQALKKANR